MQTPTPGKASYFTKLAIIYRRQFQSSNYFDNESTEIVWRTSIYETFSDFKHLLKKFERFFALIDEIKKINVSFTDISSLNYNDVQFRPNLGGGASVTIKIQNIDEDKIEFSHPMRFVGSEERISEIKTLLQTQWEGWSNNSMLTETNVISFLRIFESEIAVQSEEDRSCGICYQFDLDGDMPNMNCYACHKQYHTVCCELLLDTKCPYCDADMVPLNL